MRITLAILFLFFVSTANAEMFLGNGNTGFGGAVGAGSLQLTHDGTTISGLFTRGTSGNLDDDLVFYLDTTTGGFANTSSFDDTADRLRRAISGYDLNFGNPVRSTVNFAAGFGADYAIALNASTENSGELWELKSGGAHTLITSVNLTPNNSTSATSYAFDFTFSNVGLTSTDSIDFVGTYLNGNGVFRAGEAFGSNGFDNGSGNPGLTTSTFSDFKSFNVPEPTSALTFGTCLAALVCRRRR